MNTSSFLLRVGAALLFLAAVLAGVVWREEIIARILLLEALAHTRPFLTAGILITLKAVAGPLGFPGTPLTLLSGSLFGPWWGTGIALVGNTIGAVGAFLFSRFLLRDYVRDTLLPRYPRIHAYDERLRTHAFSTIVLLRAIPLVPYNGLNFVLGTTSVRLVTYAAASFLGMIPGTFVYVALGGSLRALDGGTIALSLLGIIGLVLVGKWYDSKHSPHTV